MVTKKQARAGVKGKTGTAGIKVVPLLGIETSESKASGMAAELFEAHGIDTYQIRAKSKHTIQKGQTVYGLEPVTDKDALKAMRVRRKQLRKNK